MLKYLTIVPCYFFPAMIVRNVPYDYLQSMIFQGEEMSESSFCRSKGKKSQLV